MDRLVEWVAFPGARPLTRVAREWENGFILTKEQWPDRPWFLLAHGNSSTAIDNWRVFEPFCDRLKLNLAIWEYPGYGDPRRVRSPTINEVNARAEGAWSYMVHHRGVNPGQIILAGHSVGSGPTCHLLSLHHREVHSVFLLSAFTSLRAMLPRLCPGFIIRDRYNNERALSRSEARAFIAHGQNDDVIPSLMSELLHRPGLDSLVILPRRGHSDIIPERDLVYEYREFLQQYR